MFTTFRFSLYAEDRATAETATDECFKRVAQLNAIFSDYDPTSELMRLCAPEAQYPARVSPELFDLLKAAVHFAELTNGAFDPTCGHLTHLWRHAKRQGKLPNTEQLQKAIAATNWKAIHLDAKTSSVTLDPGTLIDLGGIAKGWTADECLRLLKKHGITRAIVLAGGDVAVGDTPPGEKGWEVKLRTFSKPGPEEELKSVFLANAGVSTSGDLYQFTEIKGKRYSHIISPRTGMALTQRIACSVIGPDATTSDGLDNAMCVLGREAGEKLAAALPGVQVRFAELGEEP